MVAEQPRSSARTSATRRDTCLVIAAGGFVGFNTQVTRQLPAGLRRRLSRGARARAECRPTTTCWSRCRDNAVDNSSLNSVWTGNQLTTLGANAGAVMSIHDTIGNQVIVGNQFAVNPTQQRAGGARRGGGGTARRRRLRRRQLRGPGRHFDSRGRCEGGTCGGDTCDDDGGCAGCGGRCTDFGIFDHDHVANLIVTGQILIENATNLVVEGNVVIGRAAAGPLAQIHLVNPRADAPIGGIVVASNRLGQGRVGGQRARLHRARRRGRRRLLGPHHHGQRVRRGSDARSREAPHRPARAGRSPDAAARDVALAADRRQQLRQHAPTPWSASTRRRCARRPACRATSASVRATVSRLLRQAHGRRRELVPFAAVAACTRRRRSAWSLAVRGGPPPVGCTAVRGEVRDAGRDHRRRHRRLPGERRTRRHCPGRPARLRPLAPATSPRP